ncbi:efflux RND transporter periplasmic adaptor subunit [Malonomonas rubra]|uniref:efflux RND transporter periplasmic adaptor subunit n=1 Tax=Malonomonas rubra TaxID=57040 RepID=UPI0026EDC37F|nr:efflux RND transporter periplasmic adaptor subunit [Malonomonas rubra]
MKKILVLGCLLMLAACSSAPEQTAGSGGTLRAQIVSVSEQPFPLVADFPGSVIATREVQVASRIMGYVEKLRAHEGQNVKAGELLLALDPNDVNAGIHQAQAALGKADSVLVDAAANYERFLALYQEKAIPEQQFQQVEMGYKVAQGDRAAAAAGLEQAKAQLAYVEVKAPFAAVVVNKFIDVGQLVGPGQPLVSLQETGALQVQVQVSQQAYEHLLLGQQLTVTFDGRNEKTQAVQATVSRLVAAADPVTHSHTVKLDLPVDSCALAGDFVRVRVAIGEERGVIIPRDAIMRRAGIDGVFVLDSLGKAAFRMVRLGPSSGAGILILSGLVAGDQLIIDAEGELYNGALIEKVQGQRG